MAKKIAIPVFWLYKKLHVIKKLIIHNNENFLIFQLYKKLKIS